MIFAMVNFGVIITKALVWMALFFYLVSLLQYGKRNADKGSERRYRLFFTAGGLAYLLHVLLGFQNFHGWSHEAALESMAMQTYDWIEVRSGAVLYLNYFFTVIWIGEMLWIWAAHEKWKNRKPWMGCGIHLFIAGVLFCGMVVFAEKLVRAYGISLFFITALVLIRRRVSVPKA